ncbi:hypothetical protein LIPSTDRAFT_69522 [Lipomyces starkeyi NRRL Y-11557]|uniref:Uncharacterized protein n=1 Tax=Lipomyces starkeyi NRRL Y-11557 TaxID=675824 RepID=A0A1E3QCJ3_LIPST|nr:hypothetical protein LIPSTDRAFT_69522 [Lipomyces starkeyi NRRL Y-11557]
MLVTALKSIVRTALHQYVDNWYTEVKEDYLSPDVANFGRDHKFSAALLSRNVRNRRR